MKPEQNGRNQLQATWIDTNPIVCTRWNAVSKKKRSNSRKRIEHSFPIKTKGFTWIQKETHNLYAKLWFSPASFSLLKRTGIHAPWVACMCSICWHRLKGRIINGFIIVLCFIRRAKEESAKPNLCSQFFYHLFSRMEWFSLSMNWVILFIQ